MRSSKSPILRSKPPQAASSSYRGIYLAIVLFLLLPNLIAQASPRSERLALLAADNPESGVWRLVGSDQSDSWQGDEFHGLKSEYTPFFNGDSIGATYTQYNIQFTAENAKTVASQLTGTCSWQWEGGSIPLEVVPGTNYPFSMAVDATLTGNGMTFATVNGYTLIGEGSIAFAQVFLDTGNEVRSGQQVVSGALNLAPGKNEGESRTVTLLCQIDIVKVQIQYYYQWSKAGCTATLALPEEMKPGETFTPSAEVVDSDQKVIKPKSQAWYYNGEASANGSMKWDGKAALVEYEYTCPNETQAKKVRINIPPAGACRASIILPDKMEPDKEFIPQATVVDLDNKPVLPEGGAWYFNDSPSSGAMKWDGKAATVRYEYICPLDQQPGKAKINIPAADESSGWLVVVGGAAAVAAAGLAAVAAGGILVKNSGSKSPKGPPPPKYILQVDKKVLEVKPKENAPLNIQAWRLNADGSVVLAPEAAIQVILPASAAGLVVTPASGQGSLHCAFSVPLPSVCADVPVTITAAAGLQKTQALVMVKIVPLYELELSWYDPQQKILQAGAKEIYACARLTATPLPDTKTTPDTLAEKIKLGVEGPNTSLVELKTAPPDSQPPFIQKGLLWIPIRATAAAQQDGNPTLIARFNENNQRLEKSLTLELNPDLVLGVWAQGKKQADVIYNDVSDPPGWFFGELTVYFHAPQDENKPIEPGFKCDIGYPEILVEPADTVELRNYEKKRPDWFNGDVYLRQGVDLENFFGADLTERNAQIKLTVKVTSDMGKVYTSTVTYQVCPTAELVARQCDEESGEPIQSHEYKGLDLGSYEFLADGEDCLSLMLYYRRTDWPPETDRRVRFGSIVKVGVAGPNGRDYKVGSEAEPFSQVEGSDGLWYTSVSSLMPLLASASRKSARLSMHVEGRLSGQPAYYRRKSTDVDLSTRNDTLDQAIKPVFLHLNLWVIPGWKNGTSIAGAIVVVPQANGEQATLTSEYELELCTESNGPALAAEPVTALHGADKRGQTAEVPVPDWLKAWRLHYSGLEWEAIKQARFSVFCRFKDAPDAVSFTIDVDDNGSAMFAALISDANQIDLTNPEWDQWDNLWSFNLLNKIILPEFRGPIYNMRRAVYMLLYGSGNMPRQYENYSCGDYSLRIRTYLQKRRHGSPATALKMNGLEIAPFTITGSHDFVGIYLSGMNPKDNPIFIDPWYEQRWTDKATGANYGYKFQAVKFTAAVSGTVAELFLVGRFIWQCIRITRGAASAPSLAEVLATLKNVATGLKLKIAAVLSEIAGGGANWLMMGPNSNVPEHDADLNYVFHKELALFEHYGRELEDQPSLPPVKVVDWPQGH